ncbi:MAG: dihydroneopterin triphosphate diphosphatase [Betaproteobacteria bacterium]|nr:dihydroneopterin triphosphate diphosphatase [Betaproteobacteria bacterium]
MGNAHKIPVSTLVVVHTPDLEVLLIERADRRGFWQSVTGSQDPGESLRRTAVREVGEETGIVAVEADLVDWETTNVYEIFAVWRHRYAPGVTHNTEHVFSLCVPPGTPVRLAPDEHIALRWLPFERAAGEVFSWSNRQAILMLPDKASRVPLRP